MGTGINMIAIVVGSLAGLILKSRLPQRYVEIIFQALGLFTIYMGVKLAFDNQSILGLILSLVVGGLIGEGLRLEDRLNHFGQWLRSRLGRQGQGETGFAEGFVNAFLLFGIGPMATLGALQEGLGEGIEILLTKSLLDGIASIALAAGLGVGVALSAPLVGLYQGVLTLFAHSLAPHIGEPEIAALSAAGGVMLVGLGLNLLRITNLRVTNLLPGLLVAIPMHYFFSAV